MTALRAEEAALIKHLERDDSLVALFPEQLLRRLQEARRLRLEAIEAHASQSKRAAEQRRRTKQTERLADYAEAEAAREKAEREARELLDLLIASTCVSLR